MKVKPLIYFCWIAAARDGQKTHRDKT